MAAVNRTLHFRIFDGDGKFVDGGRKGCRNRPIRIGDLRKRLVGDLRKQLDSLWLPHELTKSRRTESARLLHFSSVVSNLGLKLGSVSTTITTPNTMTTPGSVLRQNSMIRRQRR